MTEQVVAWVILGLLLIACLPIGLISKLILEVSALLVRLKIVLLLAGAAYLVYRPADIPAQAIDMVSQYPDLKANLPDPKSPYFAVCLVAPAVVVLLPLLAVLDVTRKLAGRRLRRLRLLSAAPVGPAVEQPVPVRSGPVLRRSDRQAAADAMAALGTHPPTRSPERRGR